jgi:hypothetical protein
MTEERLSRKNVALSRINEILAKIDEVCDDARMAGVEKVRRIKERGCERPRAAKGAKRKLRVAPIPKLLGAYAESQRRPGAVSAGCAFRVLVLAN